ncbi:hypothetical protein KXD40_000865 [Peronospora effusa]|nr:hypothetical protein KXD40_000865 [Peronospora effusa]
MHNLFKLDITHQQAANRFAAEKNVSRSWTERFLYLVALARESVCCTSSENGIYDSLQSPATRLHLARTRINCVGSGAGR